MVMVRFRYLEQDIVGLVVPKKFGKGGQGLELFRTSSVRRFMHLERSGTI